MRSLLEAAGIAPTRADDSVLSHAIRSIPLVALLDTAADRSRYVAATTIDDRGRLADRTIVRSLGWQPGGSITIATLPTAGIVLARSGGQARLTSRGHLRLPADVRHGCRLTAGDRLLVVADPDEDLLVAYNVFALGAMLAAYHATVEQQDAA